MVIFTILSVSISFIVFIWLRLDTFIEYAKLFNLQHLFNVNVANDDYPLYLKTTYNNFITRLLYCPFCLCFWISVIACLVDSFFENQNCLLLILPLAFFSSLFYLIMSILYSIYTERYN